MSSTTQRIRAALRTLRRAVLRRRRALAALCTAVAVAAGVHAVAAPPPPTTSVLTAARDLPAGAPVAADDVVTVEFAPGTVPAGTVADPVGRTLAGPLREGEPVTDVRLVGEALAAAHPELVTMPVRFPDADLAGLLEVGDRIDLVATDPQGAGARQVASGVLVLATPATTDEPAGTLPGVVVVLGVPATTVTAVSDASVRWFLTYAFAH
ncbi:SAF domain-containing protein [Nocardioides euryhalodurans]|uniref:Pilus assembly protein CpaB n=1 Tax=Nocardioides euryhalodurans TaxID=2518370 RepID=A0A4P7GK27_9ACTN|nr:SAF domain-containing protein [Nocardioides euryhalodurans]QBR92345.1 pilus assembly protein CpaB [Nocardioides euryhalodurans]